MTLHQTSKMKEGFTLIELSIVLVIIGLIVGGVLVGQDLIKAAEVRAFVGQLEKYNAAVNTFRGKYNGFPGDHPTPANFGFDASGSTSLGDGVVNRTTDNTTSFDLEAAVFFRHLGQASLISETIAGEANYNTATISNILNVTPAAKMGRGIRVATYGSGGLNYFALGNLTVTAGVMAFNNAAAMAVIDALQVDSKLDDGLPATGTMLAVTNFTAVDAGVTPAANDECVVAAAGATPAAYNTTNTARAADTECTLRYRASF